MEGWVPGGHYVRVVVTQLATGIAAAGISIKKGREKARAEPYCTFTALLRKCLIINGAGEGNRTLVTVQGASVHSTTSIPTNYDSIDRTSNP
jgi:hypothetical protein